MSKRCTQPPASADAVAAAELAGLRDGTLELKRHAAPVLTMKNELAAGCFPSGRFGANAAWFRLSAMLYNLLSLLKRETLPGELHTAIPKRLRFVLLNNVGTVARGSQFRSRRRPWSEFGAGDDALTKRCLPG